MKTIASIILVMLLFSFNDSMASRLNPDATKPADAPKKVVRDFLNWYKDNRERLEKFDLVLGKPGDTTQAYRVDFGETEKYLAELKKSGFVSDKYISMFRKYFQTADAKMEEYPHYDGPAPGFEFDLVLQAHDYDEILDNLRKVKYLTKPLNTHSAKVYVKFPTIVMVLVLSKSGDSWLIDSLDYV